MAAAALPLPPFPFVRRQTRSSQQPAAGSQQQLCARLQPRASSAPRLCRRRSRLPPLPLRLPQQPDIVVICTSILSMEKVLDTFPVHRLRRSTLLVDVLSVKVFPKVLMLNRLPPTVDILCLHPMFGPESGKGSWSGLPLVYDKVRVGTDPNRERRCGAFLSAFESEGCRMVEMSCEEHDKLAASSQFITHTVGRMLGRMVLPDTPINTKGYESLLSLVNNTNKDSFDLYYGLFMYNEVRTSFPSLSALCRFAAMRTDRGATRDASQAEIILY